MANPATGLSESEATSRLKADGYNELPQARQRTVPRIALEIVKEPMFALLIGSGAIYLVLGDIEEAMLLLALALVSVGIAIVQESRSENVLRALRALSSPRALVIRDGNRRRIPGRDVVRGDLLVLSEGDRVPADGILRTSSDLLIDESHLTGESVPVRKIAAGSDAPQVGPGGDDLPFVFAGSLVVRGHGLAEITATGARSEMGHIGASLRDIESGTPRLTLQTRRLVRVAAVGGFAISAGAVLLYGTLRGDWLQALLGGIAIGMSMLPEEFPLVLTVFMVMGAWRISQARVLTRRSAAIETLGSATVLCTDKTGTLTENRMKVIELRLGDRVHRLTPDSIDALPDIFAPMVDCGVLASAMEPFDPMEVALHSLARATRSGAPPHEGRTLSRTWGLRPHLLAVTQAWQSSGSDEHMVAAKGAPEAVAQLCRFDAERLAALRREVNVMASEGLRVLGVARTLVSTSAMPNAPTDLSFEFLGLIGLADPLRAEVPAAVAECRAAGIRVIMITGDYPVTAQAIARQAGLASDDVMTGEEVERCNDDELAQAVRTVSVFARIRPIQKLRIVEALKRDGEIVAMTGDGVNDAPSLKASDIGIAMGGRGTDVAREAASIVLLDDDFGSIVRTIRLGRRIYDNLRKAMGYIVAVHAPIAGLAILPLLFGTPIVLAPIHIAFLEMVIDPVCSVVFEAEPAEGDAMRRPPRSTQSPLFSTSLIAWSLLQGGVALLLVASVYFLGLYRGMPDEEVRALAFTTLVLTNVGLILVNRSFSSSLWRALSGRNPALWVVMAVVVPLLVIAATWAPIQHLFDFGPLHLDDLAIGLGATILLLTGLEAAKRLWHTRLVT